jgi:hypothetical protein
LDASNVGQRSTIDFLTGNGITPIVQDTGSKITVQLDYNGGGYAHKEDENFFPSLKTDGAIGKLGWKKLDGSGTGTVSIVAAEANHWGIYRYSTASADGNNGGLQLYLDQNWIPDLSATANWRLSCDVRVGLVATASYRVGLGNTGTFGNDSITAWYDTNDSDTTWKLRMCNGGTCGTNVDTGVTLTNNTWYRIVLGSTVAGTVTLSVNGSAAVSKSTNFPTLGHGIIIGAVTRTTAARTIDADYCSLEWN